MSKRGSRGKHKLIFGLTLIAIVAIGSMAGVLYFAGAASTGPNNCATDICVNQLKYSAGQTLYYYGGGLNPGDPYAAGVVIDQNGAYLFVTTLVTQNANSSGGLQGTFYLGSNVKGAILFALVDAKYCSPNTNTCPVSPPNVDPPIVAGVAITVGAASPFAFFTPIPNVGNESSKY